MKSTWVLLLPTSVCSFSRLYEIRAAEKYSQNLNQLDHLYDSIEWLEIFQKLLCDKYAGDHSNDPMTFHLRNAFCLGCQTFLRTSAASVDRENKSLI